MALCSGCGACTQICPVNAIGMLPDDKGFLYPGIINDTCTNCGICDSVCQLNTYTNTIDYSQMVFAAKLKDFNKRMQSQSGGMFAALAEYVFAHKGVVYGSILDDNYECVFTRATGVKGLSKLKGSKYVQAKLSDTFAQIRNDLCNGVFTLFAATPCQVDGLNNYLAKSNTDTSLLVTCDLVCHGVPSPALWADYIQYISDSKDSKLESFIFRDKACGWRNTMSSYRFDADQETTYTRLYNDLYFTDLGLRDSCYECQYSNTSRVADFTIGDFWGIEQLKPSMADSYGTSLVIINTDKAFNIWNNINNNLEYVSCELNDCLQHNLIEPTQKPANVESFWQDYFTMPFSALLKKYSNSAKKDIPNSILYAQWKECIDSGASLSHFWGDKGVKIALCGNDIANSILYNDLTANGLTVVCTIDNIDSDSIGSIDNLPHIATAALTGDIVNFIDYVVLTDSGFNAENISLLVSLGFTVDKLIPLSFLIANTRGGAQ